MTDKNDDPSKAQTGAGSVPPATGVKSADPKRPHATIDLKAIEVLQPAKPSPAPGSKASADTATSAAEATKPGPATAGAATLPGAGKPGEAKAAAPASTTSKASIATGAGAATTKPAPSRPAPAMRAGGIGSMLTHLLAGIIGGGMVWYGLSTLGPQLGLPPLPTDPQTTNALTARLAVLEKSVKDRATASIDDVSGKLKATEDRLAKLDAVGRSVADITAAQAKLLADNKALADKLAALSGTDGAQARIAKLEERLKLMADDAASNPQPGKLAQIAALSGSLVDLRDSMTNELSALRATVTHEMEQRLSLTNETSEAAKSGTNRIDRDLASVKSEAAATAEKIAKLRSDTDRLTSAVQGIRDDGNTLKTALDSVRSEVNAKFNAVAKPADVASAVAPMAGKITTLEQNIDAVVKSEAERKTNSERVLLALELNNLKRILERGQPYATELASVTKAAGGKVDLSILERYKDTGIASTADLARDFAPVANAIIDASTEPVEGSIMDRMLAGAKSVIRIRKISYSADDKSAEAVVGRMEAALKEGNMTDVLAQAHAIPAKAAGVAQDWLVKVEARAAVDRAIAGLEAALKTSISGTPSAASAPTPKG